MKSVFRLVPLLTTAVVALGLAFPAFAQDATKLEAPDCGTTYKGNLKAIEAVDKYTFKMTLCAPDPAIPSKVAFSAMAIQSADHLKETGGTGDLLSTPIGTGPYMLEKWDKGNEIVYTANPNYWGDAPIEKSAILK